MKLNSMRPYPTKPIHSIFIGGVPIMALICSGFLSSCVVNSPEPYQGDVAVKDTPLESIFDPEQGSYRKAPVPGYQQMQSKNRPQRQIEKVNSDKIQEYDYYYLHTPEKSELKRKRISP